MKAVIGGLTAVVLPGWAYVLAYFFEYGYLLHFGISPELMHIQYINIIAAVLSVSFFVFVLVQYGFNFLHKAAKNKKKVQSFLVIWISLILIFGLLPFITLQNLIGNSCLIVMLMITLIIGIEIWQNPGKNIEEKINFTLEKHGENAFFDWAGEKIMFTILFISFTFYISFMVGGLWARQKQVFPIIEQDNEVLIIIRIYNDEALALPWFIGGHELGKEVFILKTDELTKNKGMTRQNVGSLNIIKE